MAAQIEIMAVPPSGYLPVATLARELGLTPRAVKLRILAHGLPFVRVPMQNGGVLGICARLEDVASAAASMPRRRATGPRVVHPKPSQKAEA